MICKILNTCCIFIAIVSCSVSPNKLDCTNFRKGKFVSHIADEQNTIVDRNDTIQIETNQITGHIFKARIKWISDCEYELSNIEESTNFSDTLKPVWQNKIIRTKIVKVENGYCIYETHVDGVSMIMIDSLRIFK